MTDMNAADDFVNVMKNGVGHITRDADLNLSDLYLEVDGVRYGPFDIVVHDENEITIDPEVN